MKEKGNCLSQLIKNYLKFRSKSQDLQHCSPLSKNSRLFSRSFWSVRGLYVEVFNLIFVCIFGRTSYLFYTLAIIRCQHWFIIGQRHVCTGIWSYSTCILLCKKQTKLQPRMYNELKARVKSRYLKLLTAKDYRYIYILYVIL